MRRLNELNRFVCITAVLLITCACAPPPKVAVEERSVLTVRQETEKLGGQLIRFVQPGDTLHGIAFINDLDVNKIAAWNGIRDTSKLNVGQKIRLTEPIGFKYPASKSKTRNRTRVVNIDANRPSTTVKPSLPSTTATSTPEVRRSDPATKVAKTTPAAATNPTVVRWVWPTRGKVVGKFAIAKGRQGIDIGATAGQSVTAASGGEVVYVGNSLKGYGNLVIIKHNDQYLSAYAHNKDIYVREGQKVNSQQKIGSVGLNNRRLSALHFQIRKNGKPLDPLRFLPKL